MLCPSHTVYEGESVIGRCSEVGDIQMFERPLPLPESARSVLAERDAMRSTRFNGECIEDECVHWDDGCRLGRRLASRVQPEDPVLNPCPIRVSCRWFSENGSDACRACRFVTFPGFVGRADVHRPSGKDHADA